MPTSYQSTLAPHFLTACAHTYTYFRSYEELLKKHGIPINASDSSSSSGTTSGSSGSGAVATTSSSVVVAVPAVSKEAADSPADGDDGDDGDDDDAAHAAGGALVTVGASKGGERGREKVDEWKHKKAKEAREEGERRRAAAEAAAAEATAKKEAAQKAYKKWLKLQRRNKYVSRADGKKHDVPPAAAATHVSPWMRDTSLQDFYDENDRRWL